MITELSPNDSRKSFYGKARVRTDDDGTETLISYKTEVARRLPNDDIEKLWDGWSATTGRHIKALNYHTKENEMSANVETM